MESQTYNAWTITDHHGMIRQVFIADDSEYDIKDVLVPGHYRDYQKDGVITIEIDSGCFPLPEVLEEQK